MNDAPFSATKYLLHNASVPTACLSESLASKDDLSQVDILIEGNNIKQVAARITPGADTEVVDLGNSMVWPCFIDIHSHLDKGHIWPRTPNPDGSFDGALQASGQDREAHWSADDLRARINFSIQCAYHHGTQLIRSHLDSSPPQHQISWPLFRELREEWRGKVALQASSILAVDRILEDGFFRDLCQHITAASGVLGVVAFPSPDIDIALDRIFDAAIKYDLDLDFHVDETGDATIRCLRNIAEAALRNSFQGQIVCGHCCSIAKQEADDASHTLDLVAKAGIAVVSLPMCNMYLQDRLADRTPRWRGVTLVHEMQARNIAVAVASDNTRDPFYAYGDMDMIEVYREATRILHLDHPVGYWPAAVTKSPAEIAGRPDLGLIGPGRGADIVICKGRTWTELLSRPQADRVVIRNGDKISTKLPDYRELDHIVRR